MKTGRTLTALAAEIERRAAAKKDFLAPTSHIRMTAKREAVESLGMKKQTPESEAVPKETVSSRIQ